MFNGFTSLKYNLLKIPLLIKYSVTPVLQNIKSVRDGQCVTTTWNQLDTGYCSLATITVTYRGATAEQQVHSIPLSARIAVVNRHTYCFSSLTAAELVRKADVTVTFGGKSTKAVVEISIVPSEPEIPSTTKVTGTEISI